MPALGPSEVRPIMLGRYELVAPIGRGGMAEVHLAVQRGPAGFEKLVVIKVVHEHLASQASFVEMLLDEARHAGMIKHPNVVEIYELGEEAGRYFIAMEYLEGEPLLEVLRIAGEGGARLDPLSIARVIADTAEGLDAAHRLKTRDGRPIELVHHDVSLGNIVVLYSGLVKLVDFGVAKARSAPGGERVQGKLGYMAPEKVEDRAVDRRSDIWSLGCVLWEALTLQRLFKGDSDADTARQVLGAQIVPPSQIEPSVPPELDPIVLRALQRDPTRRYQTAKGMAADLEDVLRELKYGAKNDRIAQHMEAVFAARIAAREAVLREISSKRRPSAAALEAAFGETFTHAASTISSTEPANESTTMKTRPNPPEWQPANEPIYTPSPDEAPTPTPTVATIVAVPAAAPVAAMPATPSARMRTPTPALPAVAAAVLPARAPRETRPLTPGAFNQPRPRQTGMMETPKVFSVASLLDEPAAPAPSRPDAPRELLRTPPAAPPPAAPPPAAAPSPPAPAPEPVTAPPPASFDDAPLEWTAPPAADDDAAPEWTAPAPPIVPSLRPRDEKNPFDEDDFKTVADVIPANAEASRSLQSEPSWTVARQSASLGQLQRWVQESRNPPKSRWEALVRRVRPLHDRMIAWAQHRRLPRWSPYAAIAVVLLWTILLVAKCSGGGAAEQAKPRPPAGHGSAKIEPRTAPAAGNEIEMEEEAAPPPKQR